jgi:hypothetical protein
MLDEECEYNATTALFGVEHLDVAACIEVNCRTGISTMASNAQQMCQETHHTTKLRHWAD